MLFMSLGIMLLVVLVAALSHGDMCDCDCGGVPDKTGYCVICRKIRCT